MIAENMKIDVQASYWICLWSMLSTLNCSWTPVHPWQQYEMLHDTMTWWWLGHWLLVSSGKMGTPYTRINPWLSLQAQTHTLIEATYRTIVCYSLQHWPRSSLWSTAQCVCVLRLYCVYVFDSQSSGPDRICSSFRGPLKERTSIST